MMLPKVLWNLVFIAPALLGAVLVNASGAIAAESTPLDRTDSPPVNALSALEAAQQELISAQPDDALLQETTQETPAIAVAEPVTPLANTDAIATSTTSTATLAQISQYHGQSDTPTHSIAQITSVTQLSDVYPTDWAYQALQSLVERYGCIVGYPDSTFRGNRATTRYEFAAGLNACLDRINELIAAGLADAVTQEDLATLQRLQEEFAAELATLRGRVDALEARTAELEANQFSTTTVLRGEAIFSVADMFGGDFDDFNNTVFQYRTRLDLVTSFTGRDQLLTRLTAGNVEPFSVPRSLGPENPFTSNDILFGTSEGLLTPAVGGATDNGVELNRLTYSFPVGERLQFYVAATGGTHNDYVSTTASPFDDDDGGSGSISTFSQFSPIYRIGGGTGAGLNLSLTDSDSIVFSLGYLAENAGNPGLGSGLFNGGYSALGQLAFIPNNTFKLALTYVHGYHQSETVAGFPSISDGNYIFDSGYGNNFFAGSTPANGIHAALDVPAVTNSYGIEASFQLSSRLVLSAFGGFTDLTLIGTGDGEIWYYGAGIALPDLFRPGNLGGVFVGVEPYLGGLDGRFTLAGLGLDNQNSLHVEAFYKVQLTDNISITPGVIWVTAPEQSDLTDDYVVGTIRTTFTF